MHLGEYIHCCCFLIRNCHEQRFTAIPRGKSLEKVNVIKVNADNKNHTIELLEPSDSSSVVRKFINKRGEGLHHIALEVDDIENTVKKCGYNPGEILQLSRDDLTWKVTIPSDGKLLENGVLPFLIEWPSDQHPLKKLNNSNVSLNKLSLFHPEPNKINKDEIDNNFENVKYFFIILYHFNKKNTSGI